MDRKKELIKVKGLQVAPAELENLIRSMAGVLDVAVIGMEDELCNESAYFNIIFHIGIPDERAGEVPRAYVVRGDEKLEAKVVEVSLCLRIYLLYPSNFKDFVATALSKHKHLAGGVEFVAAIPKSAAGKILRKDLKASYMSK